LYRFRDGPKKAEPTARTGERIDSGPRGTDQKLSYSFIDRTQLLLRAVHFFCIDAFSRGLKASHCPVNEQAYPKKVQVQNVYTAAHLTLLNIASLILFSNHSAFPPLSPTQPSSRTFCPRIY
jgi:hypothetical protein